MTGASRPEAEEREEHAREIRQWLHEAETLGLPRSEARLLMAHVLRRNATWLLAHDDHPLAAEHAQRFSRLVEQRLDDVPLAYLTGERAFHQLQLQVDARVLDPRPDTETLVDWALEWLAGPQVPASPEVLDLGTGSGAIALALARACPKARVTAVDRSSDALQVAAANAQRLGLQVRWVHGNWFSDWHDPGSDRPLTDLQARFDLIVSNPPYIAESDPHLPALRHEPRGALVSGADGLADLRRIAAEAGRHLHDGGGLMLEHGHDQGPAVQALLLAGGARRSLGARHDLAGHWRCTGAEWGDRGSAT